MLPIRALYYGKDERLAEQVPLRAGPLAMLYESGDLRYIRLGDQEIVRRIYVAIRDRNWDTVLPKITNVQMDIAKNSFSICYDVENREGAIDFSWKGTITGSSDGKLSFTMDGVANSTFLKSRIGFCILHPMQECAGRRCIVEKVDGEIEKGTFPRLISPHQPFLNIRAISHQVLPDLWARVQFSGDVFEMEDQRNWTDASFKTYCTPLDLPCPVEIEKGTRVSQSVSLLLEGQIPAMKAEPAKEPSFTVEQGPSMQVPKIGLSVAGHGRPLDQKEMERIAALNLSHLRVDLKLSEPSYGRILQQAANEVKALDLPLEVAVYLSEHAGRKLNRLAEILKKVNPPVCRWLIYHTDEMSTAKKWVEIARLYLSDYEPSAPIAAGTDYFFAELNRSSPPLDICDQVCYSINPQVHAFDIPSLVETLETQGATLKSARQFCDDLPLVLSAITLKMRSNPDATGPEPAPLPGQLPSQVDERQMSLFGAGWTVGSLKYISENGAASATYYETSGWRGVMECESGSPAPDKFRSIPGSVYPLYHVFADVGEFSGGQMIPSRSSNPLVIDGLALVKDDKTRVILANFSADRQAVLLKNLGSRLKIYSLNETNAFEAIQYPERFRSREGDLVNTSEGKLELLMLPYEIARIDT